MPILLFIAICTIFLHNVNKHVPDPSLSIKRASTSRMALSKIPQKDHEISDNSDDERFLVLSEIEKNKILDGSKKKSTNKATETHVNLLKRWEF